MRNLRPFSSQSTSVALNEHFSAVTMSFPLQVTVTVEGFVL